MAQQPNQSRFLARLNLKAGKPQIDSAALRLSEKFCAASKCRQSTDGFSVDAGLLTRLRKRLEAALSEMRFIDEVAIDSNLTSESEAPQKPPDDAGPEKRGKFEKARAKYEQEMTLRKNLHEAISRLKETVGLRNYTGSFNEFLKLNPDEEANTGNGPFEIWRRALVASQEIRAAFVELKNFLGEEDLQFAPDNGREFISAVIQGFFAGPLATALSRTSLRFVDDDQASNKPNEGLFCFLVSDPLLFKTKSTALVGSVVPPSESSIVINALEDAQIMGLPWSPEEMEAALKDYYWGKGYPAEFGIDKDKKTIEVRKSRIDFIRLPRLHQQELHEVLRSALPKKSLEELLRNDERPAQERYLHTETDQPDSPFALGLRIESEANKDEGFLRLVVPEDFISFNTFIFQRVTLALNDIGYQLIPGTNRADLTRHFTVLDLTAAATAPRATTQSHPTPQEFLGATLYKFCPPGQNHFYGGLEHRPAQGRRIIGGYTCKRLGPGALGLTVGENGRFGGGVSYSGLAPFTVIGRQPSLQFDASTSYERNRFLNAGNSSERREGAMVRTVFRISPPAETRQADLAVEARRQTVTLQGNNTFQKQNLTTLDVEGRLFLDMRSHRQARSLEILSRVKLGLGFSREPSFRVFTLNDTFHSDLGRLFAVDLKGHAGLASDGTPIFELPSFGAPETIRGFRRDDAIGSRMWSLQPELWLPVRGMLSFMFDPISHSSSKLRKFVRDSFSLAAFSDVGGIYRTVSSKPGTRFGPGLGIRFIFGKQATLRLDWAHGIGDGATGKGRSHFYFTFDLLENQL